MFFGIGKPEEVRPEDLFVMLDALFERKLGSFVSRSSAIINDLKRVKIEFADQSGKFEKDDGEPYVGNIYLPNITGIKSQKGAYAKALRHAMDKMSLEAGGEANSYDRCKIVLANVDAATNEILKLNASFKLAMFCYPAYVASFRKLFSAIEKLHEALEREVDGRAQDASEYAQLRGNINDLLMQIEEIGGLRQGMAALKDAVSRKNHGTIEKNHEELSQKLSSKRSELDSLNNEISKFSEKINSLLLPLDRPAKKLDHISTRRKQLHQFISNPFDAIKGDDEYLQFIALLKELKEAIKAGTIETKNNEGTIVQISTLLDSDILGTIDSVRLLRTTKLGVEREIGILVRAINDITESKSNSEQLKQDAIDMENRSKELERDIALAQAAIVSGFLRCYRKRISIIL